MPTENYKCINHYDIQITMYKLLYIYNIVLYLSLSMIYVHIFTYIPITILNKIL